MIDTQKHGDITAQEYFVPIVVNEVYVDGTQINTEPVNYYNKVVVGKCKYNPKKNQPLTYQNKVKRLPIGLDRSYQKKYDWPEHPRVVVEYPIKDTGTICLAGAVALIVSTDGYVLLIERGGKWGFPKGCRDYHAYQKLVNATVECFIPNEHLPVHDKLDINTSECESSLENIMRETREETGIILDPSYFLPGPGNVKGYSTYYVKFPYTAAEYYDKFLAVNGTDHESQVIRWMKIEELVNNYISGYKFNHITVLTLEVLAPYMATVTGNECFHKIDPTKRTYP